MFLFLVKNPNYWAHFLIYFSYILNGLYCNKKKLFSCTKRIDFYVLQLLLNCLSTRICCAFIWIQWRCYVTWSKMTLNSHRHALLHHDATKITRPSERVWKVALDIWQPHPNWFTLTPVYYKCIKFQIFISKWHFISEDPRFSRFFTHLGEGKEGIISQRGRGIDLRRCRGITLKL